MSFSPHWNLAQAITCISGFILGGCLFKCKDYYAELKTLIVFLTYSESRLSYISSLGNTTVFPLFCFQVPFHPLLFADQENGI